MKEQLQAVRTHPFLRVLLIGFLMLLLQIPIGMLHGVISERAASRDEAVADITGKWGQSQALVGPLLVVPFTRLQTEILSDGKTRTTRVTDHAVFLPQSLDVQADITSETRYRGIYEVPVYSAGIQVRGEFGQLDLTTFDAHESNILWDKATVTLMISDVSALTSASTLEWGGRPLALRPGAKIGSGSGIHAKVTKADLEGDAIPFSLDLSLNGSGAFSVAPVGSQTTFGLKSNWPDPSFGGTWLPQGKTAIGADGFESDWSVSLLGRDYPQTWVGLDRYQGTMRGATMSVRFLADIDPYRMAFRSVKYEILLLVFVFMTLWVFEVLSGLRIHSIQYLFVGVAMCMFYLLELSLAEHIGFAGAYALAAAMVCGLVAGYCRAVLRTGRRAAVIGAVLSTLYGYLYMLLVNQDFALLAGSIGLFFALALVMYLTRNVQWSRPQHEGASPGEGPGHSGRAPRSSTEGSD
jgi:inner membrane protein